jgi:hypothetical protein
MADTTLTLGDFTFQGWEIPERIPFGGEQDLAVQKLIGGARVIDATGWQPHDLTWSGRFQGKGALARARLLEGLFRAGKPLTCSWSELSYLVVPHNFTADFERFYQLPYSLTLTVVKPLATAAPKQAAAKSLNDQVKADMTTAQALAAKIANNPLSAAMGTLNTAISKVSSFANAAQSTINSVLAPLAAVQGQVSTLIASVGNTLQNVTTVGGLIPGNPLSQMTAKLTEQVTAMTQAPDLYGLSSVLDRISTNIQAGSAAGATVTMAGGDLYHLASKVYGDVSAWTDIAQANNLTDPLIAGIATLRTPALLAGLDGIPGL